MVMGTDVAVILAISIIAEVEVGVGVKIAVVEEEGDNDVFLSRTSLLKSLLPLKTNRWAIKTDNDLAKDGVIVYLLALSRICQDQMFKFFSITAISHISGSQTSQTMPSCTRRSRIPPANISSRQ
jgi:hypothetical protein